jgi:hypothetical protein
MAITIQITRLTGFGRGKTDGFTQISLTLGTNPNCDVRFDPTWDKTVSGEHAVLTLQQGEWWLEDRSKDGCWIEGKLVARQKMQPGTVIELGKGGPRIKLDFATAQQPEAGRSGQVARSETVSVGGGSGVKLTPVVKPEAMTPPAPAPLPASSAPAPGRQWNPLILLGVTVVVMLVFGVVIWKLTRGQDDKLAAVAKEYEGSIGQVIMGDGGTATAWAVGPHVFASNGHVSEPVRKGLENGVPTFVVINKHPEKRYRIVKAVTHPKFTDPDDRVNDKTGKAEKHWRQYNIGFDGKASANQLNYDVGLLYVEETLERPFKLAPQSELRNLDSGYRVAFLGFPTERMAGDGVNSANPVAIMQSGILTSVTDYWLAKSDFETRFLLEHNLGATGGASGSPIFNSRGEVVGLLNAGNLIKQAMPTKNEKGETVINFARAPSAVMVNFGQRVDLLKEILPEYPK